MSENITVGTYNTNNSIRHLILIEFVISNETNPIITPDRVVAKPIRAIVFPCCCKDIEKLRKINTVTTMTSKTMKGENNRTRVKLLYFGILCILFLNVLV